MRVEPASQNDLAAIRVAYAGGRAIQQAQRAIVWPEFPDAAILAEIDAGRLLRVCDGNDLAGVFSVAYEDEAIWGERDQGCHIYLHRIARAAGYSGAGLMRAVLAWSRAKCQALGRSGLRMDTWANNAHLVDYYQQLGFALVGRRRIDYDARLPAHYYGVELALLECPVA